MAQIRLDTGVQKFEFTDTDGHVFAHFSINPADINLAARAAEVSEYFKTIDETPTAEKAIELNREIEEKIAYVLGCDREDVFGEISAMTIFPDGQMYSQIVMNTIVETVEPVLEDRKKKLETATDKYLKQYEDESV